MSKDLGSGGGDKRFDLSGVYDYTSNMDYSLTNINDVTLEKL